MNTICPQNHSSSATREYYNRVKEQAILTQRAKRQQLALKRRARKKEALLAERMAKKQRKMALKTAKQALAAKRKAVYLRVKMLDRNKGRVLPAPILHKRAALEVECTRDEYLDCMVTLRDHLLTKLSRDYTRRQAKEALARGRSEGHIPSKGSLAEVMHFIDNI